MSNSSCNDGKYSSPNSCNNPMLENRQDLLLGWFHKLNVDDKEELIRELQGISMQKLPSEREEDFKSRHFQELLKKLSSNSKTSVGSKILKAYLKVHCSSPNSYNKNQHFFKPEQYFIKVKSIDSRQPVQSVLQKRATISDVGGKPQGGQGSGDQQQ